MDTDSHRFKKVNRIKTNLLLSVFIRENLWLKIKKIMSLKEKLENISKQSGGKLPDDVRHKMARATAGIEGFRSSRTCVRRGR